MTAGPDDLSDLGRAAVTYARRGLVVFPQYPSRAAYFKGWLESATSDISTIVQWWRMWPDANPACVLERSSLLIIDVDVHPGEPDGFALLAELQTRHGMLPPTATVASGGGGAHLWYHVPPSGARTCRLAPSLEVKAGRVGVPLPPSTHRHGGTYTWRSTAPVADLPAAWQSLVAPPPAAPPARMRRVYGISPRYGRKVIQQECYAVSATPDGCGRNPRLWTAAYRLGGLVPGGFVAEAEAMASLVAAARCAGMPVRKSLDTIRRGLRAGMQRPRHPALHGTRA